MLLSASPTESAHADCFTRPSVKHTAAGKTSNLYVHACKYLSLYYYIQLVISPPIISPGVFGTVLRMLSHLCNVCPPLAVDLLKLGEYMSFYTIYLCTY